MLRLGGGAGDFRFLVPVFQNFVMPPTPTASKATTTTPGEEVVTEPPGLDKDAPENSGKGAPISPRLPGILGLQQKAAGGNHPIFANIGHRNVNLGFSAAAMAEQKANLALQTCGAVAKVQIRTERWARDLKINQEKGKYRAPADKKAVGYLIEEKFDLKELQ